MNKKIDTMIAIVIYSAFVGAILALAWAVYA